jgi:undecaprenyl-diphosphatase
LSRKQVITFSLMIGIFVFFAVTFNTTWIEQFDAVVGDGIRTMRGDFLTSIFIFITDLGEFLPILIIGLIFVLFGVFVLKLRWKVLIVAVAVLCSWVSNALLKLVFVRARPTVEHLSFADGYSFPSGHAMVSTTFYGILGYILWQYFKEKGMPVLARCIYIFTIVWIVLMGVTRVYLGVHFPSDIIAGTALGYAWLLLAIAAMSRVKR